MNTVILLKKQKTTHDIITSSSKKRKCDEGEDDLSSSAKKIKISLTSNNKFSAIGLLWDSENYSCAYDALFVILYDIWSTNPSIWTSRFSEINLYYLKPLSSGFKNIMNGQSTFETVREHIRQRLYTQNETIFPYGTRGTSVIALATVVLAPDKLVAISNAICGNCPYSKTHVDCKQEFVIYEKEEPKSTSTWLASLAQKNNENSPHCLSQILQPIAFKACPSLLVFQIDSTNVKISKKIKFVQDGENVVLDIRGLIYYSGFHFTSRIITFNGDIWYHDGITMVSLKFFPINNY
jgi:hypothetical protein